MSHTDGELIRRRYRKASEFSANEREVIAERRHGAEQADCVTLALIFDTTPQAIAAIAGPSRESKR